MFPLRVRDIVRFVVLPLVVLAVVLLIGVAAWLLWLR
jgi:hypothetical protein